MEIKINLGCGRKNVEGYVGVDMVDFGFNKIRDMETQRLPFEDGEVDEIFSEHFFEHLRDVQNCLNECWRVLKSSGKLIVIVPYGLWAGASKPVHHQMITECWFDWLRRDDNWERYGYASWDIKDMSLRKNKDGEIYEIYCELTPKK